MLIKKDIERDLYPPVEAYFMKKFKKYKDIIMMPEVKSKKNKVIDMIIIKDKINMHTIEIESTAINMFSKKHGFKQIEEHNGNFKWLVLPEEEYLLKKKEIYTRCKREKIGLLTVKMRDAEYYAKQSGYNKVYFNSTKKYTIFNRYNAPRIDEKDHMLFYPVLSNVYEEINSGDYSNVTDFDYS